MDAKGTRGQGGRLGDCDEAAGRVKTNSWAATARRAQSSCGFAADQLAALLDGELAPAERDWVEGHLADCPICDAERKALSTVREAVSRALASTDFPMPSREALFARLDAGDTEAHVEDAGAGRVSRGAPRRGRSRAGRPGVARRTSRPWGLVAGSTAALAILLAVVTSPSGRGLQAWLEAPSTPVGVAGAPALTLTGRVAAREPVSRAGVPAARARSASPEDPRRAAGVLASEPSRDLQVPDELRRRPGMFVDMGIVRRLDKLKKMEAVYGPGKGGGRAG